VAWNGRPAGDVVTSLCDQVTGVETIAHVVAGRGVLLDIGRAVGIDALAADCATDRVYEFWLTAAPVPITGAVGSR
jgi:hypothetical protein